MEAKEANAVGPGIKASVGFNDFLDLEVANPIITPVGLETLAASIGEDAGTLEDVYEPYLLMNGLINRTPRGRTATELAYRHFGIERPQA